jgi:GTP-binding protein
VFVLIDSRHKPQKIDLEFISQLDKWQIPFSLVFTKTDKEKPGVVANNIQQFFDTLRSTWQFLPQHFVTSAEKHQGREDILQFIQMKNESVA